MYLTFDPAKDQTDARCTLPQHEGVPSLHEMQEAVGGWIEAVDLFEDSKGRVTLYCDEEFLYKGTQPTVCSEGFLYHDDGLILHGPFVIVRTDRKGDTVSLLPGDLARISYGKKHLVSFRYGRMIPILEVK